ncbi:MAG: hypothetical protein JWP06_623 [Candidatus Saccharibacteria bacterium]|nr:hypothetical protein [Candidatus Saccharibacteria bacterium]
MSLVWVVANKEFRDAWRDKMVALLITCLGILVIVSIVTATQHIGVDIAQYNAALDQIKASGQISKLVAPSFAPLRLLQNSVEYFEIIGAVLAIILGYTSIARERANQTLPLMLTRQITKVQFIVGKLLGSTLILGVLIASFVIMSVLSIWIIAGLTLNGLELVKLLLTAVSSLVYLLIFYSLSALLTIHLRVPANALVVSLALWIVFVLVIPQIGDTMDVDNQVPGGFFASLNLPKGSEKMVLANFAQYEIIRNGTEEASPTKHYERASFALLGVKQEFDGKSLGEVWNAKWQNFVVITTVAVVVTAVLLLEVHRNKMIWR